MADDAMLLSLLLNATAALSDDEKGKRLLEIKQEGDKLRELNAATQKLLDDNQMAATAVHAERVALAAEKTLLDTKRAKLADDTQTLGQMVATHQGQQDELNRAQADWTAHTTAAEADLRLREAAVTDREHIMAGRGHTLDEREAAVAAREAKMREAGEHAKRLMAALA